MVLTEQPLAISLSVKLVHVRQTIKLFKFVMRHINLIRKTIVYFTLNFRAPLEIHQDFIYICATEETIRNIVLVGKFLHVSTCVFCFTRIPSMHISPRVCFHKSCTFTCLLPQDVYFHACTFTRRVHYMTGVNVVHANT